MIYKYSMSAIEMSSPTKKVFAVVFVGCGPGLKWGGRKASPYISPIKILIGNQFGIYLSEFSDKFQFYLIPAGCTKDMQPIDQGLAARIHDIGKKVTSIKGLDKVVQETINEAWIKQVWAEVKRKATE